MQIRKTTDYEKWFRRLKDSRAKMRINARLKHISEKGQLVGDVKPVGDKVFELRFDMGPGYRVYVTQEGSELVLLLIGGDKSTQRHDIERAKRLAAEWRTGR